MYPPFPYRRALLCSLIATLAHNAQAAEEGNLSTITVTASPMVKANNTTTSLSEEQVDQQQTSTSDTASLLEGTPGLSLQTGGGVSSLPTLHGLADDRLRIKVDGMDLISACGNHMNPPMSYIDPSQVAKATVIAGISPVSLGGDSLGGTILIESEAPLFAQSEEATLQTGEVGTFYRSNGNAYGGNLAATLANDTFSLGFNSSTTQSDNYTAAEEFKDAGPAAAGRENLDGDEVGSSYYKSTNHALTMGMRQENHLFTLKLGQQDIPEQGWVNQRMDMTGNDSTQINFGYEGDYDWGSLEARAYNEHTRHKMQFGDDKLFWYGSNTGVPTADGEPCTPSGGMTGCAAGMPMDTEGDNTGASVKAEIPLSSDEVVRVGAEMQKYRLDDWWDPSGKGMWPNTFWNINDGQRDRLAAFVEWDSQVDPHVFHSIGLRYEKVEMDTGEVQGYNTTSSFYLEESTAFNAADRSMTDHNFDLTALARISRKKDFTFEMGFARKTRSPNLYERYTWSTGGMAMRMINLAGDGNGYVGNLELDPEVANTISTTFDWHSAGGDKWGVKFTPYYTHIDDYIDAKRCVSDNSNCGDANQTATESFVYLQFVNQQAYIYGADLSGHMPLAENTRFGNFDFTGMLSYVRGKNSTTGDNLYNMMPLNARLSVEQDRGSWSNAIEVELVDEKKEVSATRNEMPTDAYGLIHLRSSYEYKSARVDFGIENVLNKFYNHPLGGAYTGQGKTMSGTDVAWGTPVPGMGRSFYVGLNVKL